MADITIHLRLTGTNPDYELQWSYDQSTWSKVQPNSPSTEVDSDDNLDWSADDTIQKVKIKFDKGNIIPNVSDDDTKDPKGKVKSNVARGLTDSYTIKVQPSGGGGLKEYDPDIKTPTKGRSI